MGRMLIATTFLHGLCAERTDLPEPLPEYHNYPKKIKVVMEILFQMYYNGYAIEEIGFWLSRCCERKNVRRGIRPPGY